MSKPALDQALDAIDAEANWTLSRCAAIGWMVLLGNPKTGNVQRGIGATLGEALREMKPLGREERRGPADAENVP